MQTYTFHKSKPWNCWKLLLVSHYWRQVKKNSLFRLFGNTPSRLWAAEIECKQTCVTAYKPRTGSDGEQWCWRIRTEWFTVWSRLIHFPLFSVIRIKCYNVAYYLLLLPQVENTSLNISRSCSWVRGRWSARWLVGHHPSTWPPWWRWSWATGQSFSDSPVDPHPNTRPWALGSDQRISNTNWQAEFPPLVGQLRWFGHLSVYASWLEVYWARPTGRRPRCRLQDSLAGLQNPSGLGTPLDTAREKDVWNTLIVRLPPPCSQSTGQLLLFTLYCSHQCHFQLWQAAAIGS